LSSNFTFDFAKYSTRKRLRNGKLFLFSDFIIPFGINIPYYTFWFKLFYMYIEKFARQLKELIGERSVSSVAKEIGIPQPTLSRYLLCKREIGLENLCKIANYFNEDLDFLTGRKEY